MFAHDNCLHPWTAITSPPPSTRSTPLGHTGRPVRSERGGACGACPSGVRRHDYPRGLLGCRQVLGDGGGGEKRPGAAGYGQRGGYDKLWLQLEQPM
eukprot:jgi/Undpi1/4908/HiC_scaffold_19.g08260.m1